MPVFLSIKSPFMKGVMLLQKVGRCGREGSRGDFREFLAPSSHDLPKLYSWEDVGSGK
jgi:superfamily II DNA/RNA helicase